MSKDTYRRDRRTKQQFAKDIANCTAIERKLMEKYVAWLNTQKGNGKMYSFSDNGCGNHGEYLDGEKVSTDADFVLHTVGKPDRKIEIKFSRKHVDQLHIKEHHLRAGIKDDVCMIIFSGIDTDTPKFFILRPKDMQIALQSGYKTKFWMKPCIRFYANQQGWNLI